MDDKKLFLLDAYALIYRAYYALIRSPRVTSKGFNTSAIFGFCNTIDEILKKENPTHIAVCFDPKGGHTFRHELYPEYKAQRDAQPEDITLSVPYIKDIIKAYNIPVIEIEGYEADDVIGTLSRQAQAEGYTTYMMTPDKDYGQLVTDRVFMYRPSLKGQDFEIRGVQQVCERYGISRPTQVIDLLALEGDTSDNIPGCPGVGEKTAAKLIREFDSVENLLSSVNMLKGAIKTKIEQNAEQIMFSKMLVTIKTDVPINIAIEDLRRKPQDTEALRKIFTELEFRTFLSRLGDEATPAARQPSQPSLFDFDVPQPAQAIEAEVPGETVIIDKIGDAKALVDTCLHTTEIGISLYAPGEEAMTAKPLGLAIATGDGAPKYLKLPVDASERQVWFDTLRPVFASDKITIISHDTKRDYIILKNNRIDFRAKYFDTSVAHYLLQPEMRHRLSDVAPAFLNYTLRHLPESKGKAQYPTLPEAEAAAWGGEQAATVLRLRKPLTDALREGSLMRLYDEIELPLIVVLAEMEWTGVRIDPFELAELSKQLTERVSGMEQRCYELAGHPFNIGSPRQVGEVLFEELKIDGSAKRTKTGMFSTTEEILEHYRHDFEIVDLILKIRGLNKLLATYINALPTLINPTTGKIHTTYNQTVTATGRISSTNPNLQNIPIRTEDGREIRKAFIADPGDLFLSADYSQIELRLMADMSGDPSMVEAFREGSDIHRSTASKIYKVALDEVSDDQRRKAKTANFGIIYGISAFGLSERLHIPRSEAKMLIDGYFATYPDIRQYIDKSIAEARENGYVTTIMGRKRFLPDINSRNAVVRSYAERNAVNAPIQGSAADIIKIAMIRIFNAIRDNGLRSRMIMQVHDELIFNVVPEELPQLQSIITKEMANAYHGNVSLEVSSGVGANWLEAH